MPLNILDYNEIQNEASQHETLVVAINSVLISSSTSSNTGAGFVVLLPTDVKIMCCICSHEGDSWRGL